MSHPQDPARLDQRAQLLLPPLRVPRPPPSALRRPSRLRRARVATQRDAAAARVGPRRHLGQPRRTGVGHPAPVRPGQRRLCVVRRAHQLRGGGRLRLGRHEVRALVAGRLASGRQGHHPVPLCRLAGDADERGPGRAQAGLRARLGAHQGPEDEQVAWHRARSARRGQAIRARPAPAVSHERDRLRVGRRLHVGSFRGEVQRRPGEQPRQPRQSRHLDGRAVPAGPAGVSRRGARASWLGDGRGPPDLRGRDGPAGARSGLPGSVPSRRRDQRIHRFERALGARQAGR